MRQRPFRAYAWDGPQRVSRASVFASATFDDRRGPQNEVGSNAEWFWNRERAGSWLLKDKFRPLFKQQQWELNMIKLKPNRLQHASTLLTDGN